MPENPPVTPRKRGRPHKPAPETARDETPPPAAPVARWLRPKDAAHYCGISEPSLWKAVAEGRLSPPAYPRPKAPRFTTEQLDRDMERSRARPVENLAARLIEARRRLRPAVPGGAHPGPDDAR